MRLAVPLLLVLAACGGPPLARPFVPAGAQDPLPDEKAFLDEVDRTRGHKDGFVTLREPRLVPADEAERTTPDELVIGVDTGRTRVAYPVNLLNRHEVVEQTLDGLELLVCW